jgi:hypothetical protein
MQEGRLLEADQTGDPPIYTKLLLARAPCRGTHALCRYNDTLALLYQP